MSSNLLSTAASLFMTTELAISSMSFTKTYKKGKAILAAHDNADEGAYSSSRKLFPPGYDGDFKTLKTAEGALRTWFHSKTAPYGVSASGDKADGARIVAASLLADGSFMAEYTRLFQAYADARDTFVNSYPYTVADIARCHALGASYDPNDYPDAYDVREKFQIELKGPFPIADARSMSGLSLRAEDMDRIEAQMEAQAKRNLSFAQQRMAADLAEYLKTMATNLAKYSDHHKRLDAGNRAPAIYDSLTTNVTDALKKVRTYALPDTDAGSRLIALADQIDEDLDPSALDADYLKANPTLSGNLASKAASLAEALSGQEWAYN